MNGMLLITTGSTIDELYFDAYSKFRVSGSIAADIPRIAQVALPLRIGGIMRKDSLDLANSAAVRKDRSLGRFVAA